MRFAETRITEMKNSLNKSVLPKFVLQRASVMPKEFDCYQRVRAVSIIKRERRRSVGYHRGLGEGNQK